MGKCSDTVVDLDMLVGLSTGLRCSLKPSFSRLLVSLLYIILLVTAFAPNHVN